MGSSRLRSMVAGLAALAFIAGGCGAGATDEPAAEDQTDEPGSEASAQESDEPVEADEPDPADDGDPLLADLPAELAALYEGALSPIEPSAYDDFEPTDGPWRMCFADSFQGNPWRVSVKDELERLADEFAEEGVVSELLVSVADGDVAQQNQQIRAFIDRDCDVILSIPASATGLDEAVAAAYDAGIPFVSFAGSVEAPEAINVDSNWGLWGRDMAQAIVERTPGGNVVMVKGIEGQPVAVAQNEAAGEVFGTSDVTVAAEVHGDWTPAVTKPAVIEALATNPGQVDAVWTTGSELRQVGEAFEQAGRPLPLITASASGDGLAYLKEHPEASYYGGAVLPSWTAQTAFRVAIRLLEGQQPRLNTLMVPIPTASDDDLDMWYRDCMTVDRGDIFPVAPEDPLPEDLMDAYFHNGEATPPYDYAETPDPCE